MCLCECHVVRSVCEQVCLCEWVKRSLKKLCQLNFEYVRQSRCHTAKYGTRLFHIRFPFIRKQPQLKITIIMMAIKAMIFNVIFLFLSLCLSSCPSNMSVFFMVEVKDQTIHSTGFRNPFFSCSRENILMLKVRPTIRLTRNMCKWWLCQIRKPPT